MRSGGSFPGGSAEVKNNGAIPLLPRTSLCCGVKLVMKRGNFNFFAFYRHTYVALIPSGFSTNFVCISHLGIPPPIPFSLRMSGKGKVKR
jgi:hypothetical protein